MILLELSESIFSFVLTDALLKDQFSNHEMVTLPFHLPEGFPCLHFGFQGNPAA